MSAGIWFWIIFVLSLLFTGWGYYSHPAGWPSMGMSLIQFVLFGLLGWQVFGAPIQSGGHRPQG